MPKNKADKNLAANSQLVKDALAPREEDPAEIYWEQIRQLEDKLEKYEGKRRELAAEHSDFTARYSQLDRETDAEIDRSRNQVAQLEASADGLLQSLAAVLQDMERVDQEVRLQLDQLEKEGEEARDKLLKEKEDLETRLRLLGEIDDFEKLMERQREAEEKSIAEWQEKYDQRLARFKKDLDDHEQQTWHEEVENKRITNEGKLVTLWEQQSSLTDKIKLLSQENDALRKQKKHLRQETKVQEDEISKLCSINLSLKQQVALLKKKPKEQKVSTDKGDFQPKRLHISPGGQTVLKKLGVIAAKLKMSDR